MMTPVCSGAGAWGVRWHSQAGDGRVKQTTQHSGADI